MVSFDIIHPPTIDTDNEIDIDLEENSNNEENYGSVDDEFNPEFNLFSFDKQHSDGKKNNTDNKQSSIKKETLKSYDNEYNLDINIKNLAEKYINIINDNSTLNSHDIFREKEQPKNIKKNLETINKIVPSNRTTSEVNDENSSYVKKYFTDFGLSKSLVKAINEMDYIYTTPIQTSAIPHVLNGRDLFACAKTGSGKTAAYIIPIIERLVRIKASNYTRVLIVLPTRELALQVFDVFKKLSKFTSLTVSLTTGGQLSKVQESQLRNFPDVIIATPGRLIDHLYNCLSFNLKDIEILVLDEADRLLDENFKDQLEEIVRLSSKTRQTLLFSATLNSQVEELGNISLKNPIKLFVDSSISTVASLKQEFIQIKENDEPYRFAYVCALVCRYFNHACLIFCETKKSAHRLRIVLGLFGQNVTELHGDLSQLQRYEALHNFKDGMVDILVATNLAARGLDIEGIETVINLNSPSSIQDYIHRVGRTARAGKSGRSITIIGEKDRKLLKLIAKSTTSKLQLRNIPNEVIEKFKNMLGNMENDIEFLLKNEKEAREILAAENEISRAKNKITYEHEIKSRPKRTFIKKPTKKLNSDTKIRPKINPSISMKNIKMVKKSHKLKSLKQNTDISISTTIKDGINSRRNKIKASKKSHIHSKKIKNKKH